MTVAPGPRDVLLAVDVQYDFLPGGALAVADSDAVVAPINAVARRFAHAVLTQDWHPPGHLSFASSHPGRGPFETITLDYGSQVLWPDHCVQGTRGAEISAELDVPHAELVLRKGYRRAIDSYSAFVEADRRTWTGLAGYLRERGFERIFIAGIATDFCVAYSAVDARAAGFAVVVLEDACRGIDVAGSLDQAWTRMREAGVERVRWTAIG
jgi:nicotinamidase/pyrazinamidase